MMFWDFFDSSDDSGEGSNKPFGGSGLAVLYVVLFRLSIESSSAARRARFSTILSTSVIFFNETKRDAEMEQLTRDMRLSKFWGEGNQSVTETSSLRLQMPAFLSTTSTISLELFSLCVHIVAVSSAIYVRPHPDGWCVFFCTPTLSLHSYVRHATANAICTLHTKLQTGGG